MPTVIAPLKAASPTATSAAQSLAGNVPAAANGGAADFASMLLALQKLGSEIADALTTDATASKTEVAAVLDELKSKHGKKEDGGEAEAGVAVAVDIAAILGQINSPLTPPAVPAAFALPTDQSTETAAADSAALGTEAVQPGLNIPPDPGAKSVITPPAANAQRDTPPALAADDARPRQTPDSGMAGLAARTSLTDSAPGQVKKDTAELPATPLLPDAVPDGATRLHGAEGHAAPAVAMEKAKLEVASSVRSPNWSSEVGQQVVWMAKNNVQEAQLSINPPHLGPIEITLSLKDDKASANFYSPHAEVREILEQALPRLKEMLAGAGVQLGQSDVGSQSQQAFQQFSEGRNRGPGEHSSFAEEHPSLQAQNAVTQAVKVHSMIGNGLVDTFV